VRLSLPFPEALELVLAGEPLPALLPRLTCSGATVHADVDLRAIPSPPFALRAVALAAPTVGVDATFRSFDAGRVTFDLVVRAGSVPVQRLLNQLTPLVNSVLRAAELPAGLVVVEQGPHGEPQAVLDVQAAVALRADGVTVTELSIADATVHVSAALRHVAARPEHTARPR